MRTFLIAGSLAALLPTIAGAASSTEPKAGAYLAYDYKTANTCGEATGPATPPSFIIYWPGAAKSGFKVYAPAQDASSLSLLTFPTTPPAGATSWSGTVTEVTYPGGATGSEAFTATLTYATEQAFLATLTLPITCTSGSSGSETDSFTFTAVKG